MDKKTTQSILIGCGALVITVMVILLFVNTKLNNKAPQPEVPLQFTTDSYVSNRSMVIRDYEHRLRNKELSINQLVELAQLYLEEARSTRAEELLLPKAKTILEELLDEQASHEHGRAVYASLNNVLHQFERAEAMAHELIEEGSRSAFVHSVRIDALIELGKYEEAVEASDLLLSIKPGIAAYSRAAYLRELHGDINGAIEAMELAAESGMAGHEDRSWALYQLGQLYLAENELEKARVVFEGILEETPQYGLAYGGLAWVALLEQKYEEAIYLFDAAYYRLPDGRFLEGKLEVYTLLGDQEKVNTLQTRLLENLNAAREYGENVDMEQADFLLDLDQDLEQALAWAASEYNRRPGHLHALETYGWALHKVGRSQEAIPYMERAMRLGTGDAMVYYRAGKVYEGAGQQEMGKQYLLKSLEANVHVESPSTAIEIMHMLK